MDFGKKLFKGFILCYNESNAYKMGWTMIDEERVKQMTKMAIYEEGEGKQYVPMTQYFRHDYVGKEMVKSVILGTFAFALFVVIYLSCEMENLMKNINSIDLVGFVTGILVKYGIFMAAYLLVTYVVYNVRYSVGRKHVKQFYTHMKKVNKIYEQEEK